MSVCSKLFSPVYSSCQDYVHPWTSSCYTASAGLFLHALQSSFRLYVTVYALALLMKGQKPTAKDLRRTLHGILQSTAFIGCHAVGFSLLACLLRNVLGHYNFFTFAFVPTFVSSWFAILVERPSRRSLLSLYVTNIASETLYYMLVARGVVKPKPFADVLIFTTSISCLLYLFRSQCRSTDSIYSLISFIVGPYEQIGYMAESPKGDLSDLPFPLPAPSKSKSIKGASTSRGSRTPSALHNALRVYRHAIQFFHFYLRNIMRCQYCSHPHGCLHYWFQGGAKVFAIGYGLQLSLRILMQMKKIVRNPILLCRAIKSPNTFSLGAFLGGFSFLYRFISCMMRRWLEEDKQVIALPAGFIAGFTFYFYRSNTIALYVMWKSLQILYLVGRDNNVFPNAPYASIFFHCLSTAILFHASLFEPQNLRPSYYSFLQNMSGGRISAMNRECLDHYGLESTKMLELVKSRYKRG